jgi:transcription elongation factor Elf1
MSDRQHCPSCEKEKHEQIILVFGRRITDGTHTLYCVVCGKEFVLNGKNELVDRLEFMKNSNEFSSWM